MPNSEIAFSHRPDMNMSVGAYSDGTRLLIAGAFANNGYSNTGKFYQHRRDQFSRKRSRLIIASRLMATPTASYTTSIETNMEAREFMNRFRPIFKSNEHFVHIMLYNDVEYRYPMSTDEKWKQIETLAKEVINASFGI